MAGNFRMLAKTFYGFEELLVQELKELGAGRVGSWTAQRHRSKITLRGTYNEILLLTVALCSALLVAPEPVCVASTPLVHTLFTPSRSRVMVEPCRRNRGGSLTRKPRILLFM